MKITDHLRIAAMLALPAAGLNVQAQTINAYRYWFDDDATNVVSAAVAGGQQYTLNNVDAGALPAGYHRVTLQFRDDNNAWGVPTTSLFYRNSGNLTAYQYWFDDDVSTLTETTVGPTNIIDISTQVDASALGNGTHTITLRTKDEQNGFSVPVTYGFDMFVGITEIPGLERVLLFPNPTNDRINLRIEASRHQDLRITVLDATGRTVLNEERMTFTDIGLKELDLGGLANGTYQLVLAGSKGHQSMTLVKR